MSHSGTSWGGTHDSLASATGADAAAAAAGPASLTSGSSVGVLFRLWSLGLFSFCETVLRYFLKSAPPPPLCVEASIEDPAASEGACPELEPVVGEEEEAGDRAEKSDPAGSDRALLNGFFRLLAFLSAFEASPPFPAVEGLSAASSLRALRQFCILPHLEEQLFSTLSSVVVVAGNALPPSPLAPSAAALAPVCHLYVLRGSTSSAGGPWVGSAWGSTSFSVDSISSGCC